MAQAVTWPLIYVAFLLFPIVLKGVLIQVGLVLNWQKVLSAFLMICYSLPSHPVSFSFSVTVDPGLNPDESVTAESSSVHV